MENQWIDWEECDGETQDRVYKYQKVTTKIAMPGLPVGSTFPIAVIDTEHGRLIFQDDEGVILAQFRIVCTLEPIV